MASIRLRPDMRTSGGEIHDILLNGRYAGSLSLVFRENDRIAGAVQLDRSVLSDADREKAVASVRRYVQDLMFAVRAADCDVIVTAGEFEHVIATDRDETGRRKADFVPADSEAGFEDEDAEQGGTAYCELVVVREARNRVDYHIYDEDGDFVADARFRMRGSTGFGEIRFRFLPDEEEIEAVTDLVVSDFEEDAIDKFDIRILHRGEELERIELMHEDAKENEAVREAADSDWGEDAAEGGFHASLARDDGDVLTYEIYDERRGGPPIGTATVDISERELTGFMEFRDPIGEKEREEAAVALMRELDKEKDYRSLNLSVMRGNEKIDELMFELDRVH